MNSAQENKLETEAVDFAVTSFKKAGISQEFDVTDNMKVSTARLEAGDYKGACEYAVHGMHALERQILFLIMLFEALDRGVDAEAERLGIDLNAAQ